MESRESMYERIDTAEKNLPLVNKDNWRQSFHLMPPVGWLNDPNGLCQNNGEYNVFFQYSPADPSGGEKFWGWYKSSDLINWKYMGVPMVKDTPWDADGVYSGSGLAENGTIHLFYTGNVKHKGKNYDYITSGRDSNVIYASCPKFEKKLLLTNDDYPKDYTRHIRDPKVWKENGQYYMILGGRKLSDKGTVLIYKSDTLHGKWEFFKEITTSEYFGYMWECPDTFTLGEKTVLAISPQGVESREYRFQNLYQSGYFISDTDILGDFIPKDFEEWDYGFDFYAPQTFEDERGRRILIGWVGMPDSENINPTAERGWQNCLTVPRVLEYKNGKIYQNPVKELEKLRQNKKEIQPNEVFETDKADVIVTHIEESFSACIKNTVNINYKDGVFEMNLDQYGRKTRKLKLNKLNKLRFLIDSSVIEVFINDGEYVMTTMYYTDKRQSVINSGKIHFFEMKAMEVKYK